MAETGMGNEPFYLIPYKSIIFNLHNKKLRLSLQGMSSVQTSMFLFLLPGSLESNFTAMILAFMAGKIDGPKKLKTKNHTTLLPTCLLF